MIPESSPRLAVAFVALALAVASLFVMGVHAAARRTQGQAGEARRLAALAAGGAAAWMALTFLVARAGLLRFDTRPPTMLLLLVALVAIAFGVARSGLGARLAAGLPLAALVGFHAFRLPLELIMHEAWAEGLMPVQMSYEGLNFDVLTGVSAVLVAGLIATGRAGERLARLWNVAGFVLLVNIVTIAVLSMPGPLRRFEGEPANVWVSQAPWVWLPAVMVLAALAGHLVLFRRLHGVAGRARVREG